MNNSNNKKREFKTGGKVKLHIYFPNGKYINENGDHYFDFVNFPAEDKYTKSFLMDRMKARIIDKMLKSQHTGGQFFDYETGEQIGIVSSTGVLTKQL